MGGFKFWSDPQTMELAAQEHLKILVSSGFLCNCSSPEPKAHGELIGETSSGSPSALVSVC